MTEKKVVRVEHTDAAEAEQQASEWKPTAEANSKASQLRLFAALAWLLAIVGEGAAGWFLLIKGGAFDTTKLVILIAAIVGIGALAITGNLLWKKANRYDPAHKSDTVRFFFQNQLGAIITLIAFLPLIVLIFLDKDMDAKQKGIAGGIGIVVALIATYFGIDFHPPSVEQYTTQTNTVTKYTGKNLVYWTKFGKVFHLCPDASAVNRKSSDNKIYSGTVADAHAAGKERMTKQVDLEARQCGFSANPAGPQPDPAGDDNG